jgi:ERF superfamily
MEKVPAAIATALAKAQAKVTRVGKDGANTFHRYRYTSAEALIESAIGVMGSEGLALVQCGWDIVQPAGEMPARLSVRYLLTHVSGESWEMPPSSTPAIPEKGRPWDKAEAAALTYSLGYTLRGLLKIPRADADDDVDQRDDAPAHQPDRQLETAIDVVVDLYKRARHSKDLEPAEAARAALWRRLSEEQRAHLAPKLKAEITRVGLLATEPKA